MAVKFCPLINGQCKQDECTFWTDDFCTIYLYIGSTLGILEHVPGEKELEELQEVYSQILNGSTEEFAQEYLDWAKIRFYNPSLPVTYRINDWWELVKGLSQRNLPLDVRDKIDQVKALVDNKEKDRKIQEQKERALKEKELIPDLTVKGIEWAKAFGFKSLRLVDVNAFLLENDVDLGSPTIRALQAQINTRLKSLKQ